MTIIESITAVWTKVVTFVTSIFSNVTELFYTAGTEGQAGSLTFVGVMAVIMAGVAIMLLVWNLIRSFFPMHG